MFGTRTAWRTRALGASLIAVALFAAPTTLASAQPGGKAVAGEVPAPVAQGQAQPRGGHPASAQLAVTVDLSVRESARLDAVIAAASTPGSPSYGHYLTEAEYLASYAPTGAQVSAVESYLGSQGLHVTGASQDNLLVYAKGSTAAVENAFGVAINDYQAGGREFFANDRSPSVPADLAVSSVSGLSDYVTLVPANTCVEKTTTCGATGNDFRTAYNLSGNAEGEAIAYTLWGKPVPQTSYEDYEKVTKTPLLKLGKGNEELEFVQVGEASAINNKEEILLDTESAHVVAPKAHHVYYLAKEANLASIQGPMNEAANSSAKVISNSWEAEGLVCNAIEPGIEAILQKAASLGKTFFFSTGDFGAAHGCAFPSSSQYAVAVGGTDLELGEGSVWKKETAIKNGGNCNNGIARPAWQTGIGEPKVYPAGACSGRATPDVSAVSCASHEETEMHGECFLFIEEGTKPGEVLAGKAGGTSLATPVWAAAAAVWNHNNAAAGRPGIGFVDPLLYSLGNDPVTYARDYHDITEGTNGFAAAKGWDEATGWGSPNFTNLANNQADLSYTGPTQAVDEQSLTLSATLTDHSSSQALAGRTVHFAVGAEGCEAATNGSGVASCVVQINDAPGGYTLTAKVASDAAYTEASTSSGFSVLEPPVFGRCVKLKGEKVGGTTVYHGKFTKSSCLEKSPTVSGPYEWFAGPGPKTGFKYALKPLSSLKLESTGAHSLLCTGATGSGNVTGLKTVTMALTLTGCSDGGEKCTSTGIEGEVRIPFLAGTLGWQSKALKKVALRLTGSEFVFGFYECPAKEVLLGATGILLPVTANKFSTKATDKFSETKGKQVPSALEGEAAPLFEEERIIFSPFSETIEGAGLLATLLKTYEEGYEINTAF